MEQTQNRSSTIILILIGLLVIIFMIPLSTYLIENTSADPLETPIYELGNRSLNDTFDFTSFKTFYNLGGHSTYQIFTSDTGFEYAPQLLTNPSFDSGTTGWALDGTPTIVSTTNGLATILADTRDEGLFQSINLVNNNKYYWSFNGVTTKTSTGDGPYAFISNITGFATKWLLNNITFYSYVGTATATGGILRVRDFRTTNYDNFSCGNNTLFNISTLITNKQYSPLYDDTFDNLSDEQIKAQMDDFVTNQWKFIDYTDLGIDFLTDTEITLLYTYYNDGIYNSTVFELMYNLGLSSAQWDYYHDLYLYYTSL